MKNYLIAGALLCAGSLNTLALDTDEYVKIRNLNAFAGTIDVYLNGKVNGCDYVDNKARFVSLADKPHLTSFLLTAFASQKKVTLRYTCEDKTQRALINGVRIEN